MYIVSQEYRYKEINYAKKDGQGESDTKFQKDSDL